MTINVFLVLLATFSVLTSLFTEAVKKLLDGLEFSYASNIVVLVSSVIVGGLGLISYFLFTGVEFTATNVISIILMMVANWLVAMVGYDKVKQAIIQLKGGK